MSNTFSILFYIKKTKLNKKGLAPIYCRVTVCGQRTEFSTNLSVKINLWDSSSNKCRGNSVTARVINENLISMQAALYKAYLSLKNEEEFIDSKEVVAVYQGKNKKDYTLMGAICKEVKEIEVKKNLNKVHKATYLHYMKYQNNIERFLSKKLNTNNVRLSSVDVKFYENFQIYLIDDLAYEISTANRYLKRIKATIRNSFEQGLITSNPLSKCKLGKATSSIDYLPQATLDALMNCDKYTDKEKRVLDAFIFSCHTGISFNDLKNLTKDDIQKGADGKFYIAKGRKKTGTVFFVPLIKIPRLILDKYQHYDDKYCLPIISNQKTNQYLKDIAEKAEVDRNLTFHQARHTFCSTVTLANNIPVELIQKMAGHGNMRTTQLYAKVFNQKISAEMFKLDGLNVDAYVKSQ